MHGLGRQVIGQRLQAFGGQPGELLHTGSTGRVLQYRQQMLDQCLSVARVPLQGALEAGMIEIGQCPVDTRAQLAQFSDQARLHVFETRQWLALDVVEQAHPQRLAIDVHR